MARAIYYLYIYVTAYIVYVTHRLSDIYSSGVVYIAHQLMRGPYNILFIKACVQNGLKRVEMQYKLCLVWHI